MQNNVMLQSLMFDKSQTCSKLEEVESLSSVVELGQFVVGAIACAFLFFAAHSQAAETRFATFETPFAVDSPWNQSPVGVTLGTEQIPVTKATPMVADHAYSAAVFQATRSDLPMTVYGAGDQAGPWDPDSAVPHPVTLPHWPADVIPAAGTDGHADIVDVAEGRIHSFWQLQRTGSRWHATQYAWSCLNGRGWGDPAHYFQGARAAGVPAMAGVIRRNEVRDGLPLYRHALAVSLPSEGLAADPAYVYPATSADTDAPTRNTGHIAQGALLLLPRDFAVDTLSSPALQKIARTLQTYGAYVVDRNIGTAFVVYAETNAAIGLHVGGWNRRDASDLEQIRASLRPLISATSWRDGAGQLISAPVPLNLLSLRGPWETMEGSDKGAFETWKQAVVFPPGVAHTRLRKEGALSPVSWAHILPGERLRLVVRSTGGAQLRLVLEGNDGQAQVDTGDLGQGTSRERQFRWPNRPVRPILFISGGGAKASSIQAILIIDKKLTNVDVKQMLDRQDCR